MEDLREKVYECTLAVEAHMICDLLASAGISSRVDGEFLTGAGGDLPLGNTVKVRVDPSRAAEAREVIAEWESAQPPEPIAPPARSPVVSPLWFLAGAVVGAALMLLVLRTPMSSSTVDYDGDGISEETYHNAGLTPTSIEYDRNSDGKVDARWNFDLRGVADRYEGDDDFDGRFEWNSVAERGQIKTGRLDADGDGSPDQIARSESGVLRTLEIFDAGGNRIVARQHYEKGWLRFTEFDEDGDGAFERRVEFDRVGMPK
jgi:Putative prokaryotic signal transducing protein